MLIAVCDVLFLTRQVIDHPFDRVQVVPSPTSLSEVAPEVDFKQVGPELSIPCALPCIALVCILYCSHLFSLTVEVLSKVEWYRDLWSVPLFCWIQSRRHLHPLHRLFFKFISWRDCFHARIFGAIPSLVSLQTFFHLPWKFCQRQCLWSSGCGILFRVLTSLLRWYCPQRQLLLQPRRRLFIPINSSKARWIRLLVGTSAPLSFPALCLWPKVLCFCFCVV